MARIRSIKPEFWTDPDVVAMPMEARLFFIGCWNHADDYGVLRDDPERLRLQIMPADQIDAEAIIDELVDRRHLLRRVAPDGTEVLVIRTFCVHQKIDKRAVGRWGHPDDFRTPPTDPAPSPPIPTTPTPGREGTGLDGTGTEQSLVVVPDDVTKPPEASDARTVFDAWVQSTGRDPTRTRFDDKRRRLIKRALAAYPLDDVLDAVDGWRFSPHHRGENDQGKPYHDLGLILRDTEHIERFRDYKRHPPGPPRRTGSKADTNRARLEASARRLGVTS